MKFAWDNYKLYAWGKNELRPLTRNGHIGNMFGEWGYDFTSTLWVLLLSSASIGSFSWKPKAFLSRLTGLNVCSTECPKITMLCHRIKFHFYLYWDEIQITDSVFAVLRVSVVKASVHYVCWLCRLDVSVRMLSLKVAAYTDNEVEYNSEWIGTGCWIKKTQQGNFISPTEVLVTIQPCQLLYTNLYAYFLYLFCL